MRENHDVSLIAPKKDKSGQGAAITLRTSVQIEKQDDNIYAVDGTPADCVKIASNDNKFFLRATYFTKNPGGHHTMWTFFGSHFNFFSFNYSKMSKLNLN